MMCMTFTTHSVPPWNNLVTSCSMVWDWRVLIEGSMLLCWSELLPLFVFHCFSLSSFCGSRLWGLGLRPDRALPLFSCLAMLIFFKITILNVWSMWRAWQSLNAQNGYLLNRFGHRVDQRVLRWCWHMNWMHEPHTAHRVCTIDWHT